MNFNRKKKIAELKFRLSFSSKIPIKMPSDAKKRDQARKKEAQKKRNQKIMSVGATTTDEPKTNGTTNGQSVELTEEG